MGVYAREKKTHVHTETRSECPEQLKSQRSKLKELGPTPWNTSKAHDKHPSNKWQVLLLLWKIYLCSSYLLSK